MFIVDHGHRNLFGLTTAIVYLPHSTSLKRATRSIGWDFLILLLTSFLCLNPRQQFQYSIQAPIKRLPTKSYIYLKPSSAATSASCALYSASCLSHIPLVPRLEDICKTTHYL